MVFLVTVEYTFNYVQTRFYFTKFFILEQKVSIKLTCFNILESCKRNLRTHFYSFVQTEQYYSQQTV